MFVARRAGPPPGLASGAWTVFLDLYELLNEFAIALVEVGAPLVAAPSVLLFAKGDEPTEVLHKEVYAACEAS